MKSNTLSLTPLTVNMHSMYNGKDVSKTIKKIEKANGFDQKHSGLKFRMEDIEVSKLIPLESQRITKESWAKKRLTDQGMDWWAIGTPSVVKDINDHQYYVWDGCGRLAIAQLWANHVGMDVKLQCSVCDGTKEEAAFYFGYTQDAGRRTLSKEVLFVNRWYSQDPAARQEEQELTNCGLFVKGDSGLSVPELPTPGSYEISYRAFHEAKTHKYMAWDEATQLVDFSLLKQARDMIVLAWAKNKSFKSVNQDIFWALVCFLKRFPAARKNGLNIALQDFLAVMALTHKDPKKIDWKDKGLSGNSGVAPQLAMGLLKAFMASALWQNQWQSKPYSVTQISLEEWGAVK